MKQVFCLLFFFQIGHAIADDVHKGRRAAMVENDIKGKGVNNRRILEVMLSTARHEFVPEESRRRAYQDTALPIGHGQTISSPYIVAKMTEQLEPRRTDRVLEIGTGSGYQAAVLSPLVKDVYTIEIVPELGQRAKQTLDGLGYKNVHTRVGDGYTGWPESAPFDKIIVTCSPENVPQPLVEQLVEGGHLVIPVGERFQQGLFRFTKTDGKLIRKRVESTFFVPMTGQAEDERKRKPDDTNLKMVNGGFERQTSDGEPQGWFYIRHGKLQRDAKSLEKLHCMRFDNTGNSTAQALQSIGADGSKVSELQVSFWSRGERIRTSLFAIQSSQLRIEFYNEDRKVCGEVDVPIPTGTYAWKQFLSKAAVPKNAKLAMIQIGLMGASGTIWFDDVKIK